MAKWEEIANIDISEFNKLGRKELAKQVSQLASVANKRMKRMEKQGIESPTYKSAQKYLGREETPKRFSVKGKGLNELRAEFIRVKQFLESKTSSLIGYKKVKKEMKERLQIPENEEIPEASLTDFWRFYNELQPRISAFIKGSDEQQRFAYNIWKEYSEESIEDLIARAIQKLDEEIIEDDEIEISDLFEI